MHVCVCVCVCVHVCVCVCVCCVCEKKGGKDGMGEVRQVNLSGLYVCVQGRTAGG